MKLNILLLFFLSFVACHNEENKIILTDGSEKKFVNDSTEILYYPSGKINIVKKFNQDRTSYEMIYYYENGRIGAINYVKNGKQDGISIELYDVGDTMNIAIYNMGKLINLNSWDQKGKHCIINGTGIITYYYPDGNIKGSSEMKDNKFHGKWTSYYPNGQIEYEHFFNNGAPVGKWKKWDKNGDLIYFDK